MLVFETLDTEKKWKIFKNNKKDNQKPKHGGRELN